MRYFPVRSLQTESCGGYEAFDLYELVWPEESSSSEYMECYADKKSDRIMTDMIAKDNMTPAVCRTHCEGLGAMYYATQVRKKPIIYIVR